MRPSLPSPGLVSAAPSAGDHIADRQGQAQPRDAGDAVRSPPRGGSMAATVAPCRVNPPPPPSGDGSAGG